MNKIITDKKSIDELLTRGVEKIFPDKKTLEDVLLSGKRIKLYCGYDPTSPNLHIGNAISLKKLGEFQALGHEVIFLVGDFTGMIGDPTDKMAARKKLTQEEILQNCKDYQRQASAYLKFDGENPAVLKYNSEWNAKLSFAEVIGLASNFTAQQMFQRDMFQERIKSDKPIYLHEFLYPLTQAYDSVAMDVDLEVGGNDQMFNMLAGRDLMKALKNKEKFVLTLKILADEKGQKMGKTTGNGVNLNETAENMFGQVMAWSDGLILPGFELCTNLPAAEVEELDIKNNPRDAKMRLAFEITKINHGEEAAKKAQEYFINTFSKKEVPQEIKELRIEKTEIKLMDSIVLAGLATSNADARRKIEQGGVEINGEKIIDWKLSLDSKNNDAVIKVGKFGFVKIKFL